MIKNIPFKGGGVNGIAEIGASSVLEKGGLLKSVERIAGTSAGAINAALFTVDYTTDELHDILMKLDFTTFLDRTNIIVETGEILSPRHGLHSGDFFRNWIEKLISAKTNVAFSTFRDLHDLDFPDLSIVTNYVNEGDVVICNYNSTPDVIVSEAVRASMSIPIIFDRFIFSKGFNAGQAFQDGGLQLNYPISLFDGYPEDETIGFFLHDTGNTQPPINIDSIFQYARATFESIMNAQNAQFFHCARWVKQTIVIDNLGISATDFDINNSDKTKLYESGILCANNYLSNLKSSL
jgi:NTE family protein